MATRDIAYGASGFQQDRFLAGFSMAEIQSGALLAGTRLEGAAQEVALLKAEAVCGVMLRLAALRVPGGEDYPTLGGTRGGASAPR